MFSVTESDAISLGSTQSGHLYTGHLRDSKSSITSANYGQGQLSATESSRGDDIQDETDNDSIGGQLISMLNFIWWQTLSLGIGRHV